ncbi:hypothetical protein RDI58_005609 [Solanum bulbocastanum]|uniref:Uncharacterized protein n=1 Tax=Solanum bulbocastanum TaxID=147425 RepID=A0AAN8YMQ3_SOLBU
MKVEDIRKQLKSLQEDMRDPAAVALHRQQERGLQNRVAPNTINSLVTAEGNIAQSQEEIEGEVCTFYKELLGKAAQKIPSVNIDTMKHGNTLNREQQVLLAAKMTKEEVEKALKDINDMKAPGIDGFNACFFKKGLDIKEAAYYSRIPLSSQVGDTNSVRQLYKCFMEFSNASGLVANVDKSSVYFGGVRQTVQDQILHELQVVKGELPFRKFLWTGNVEASKKALIAWEKLCWPKASGGMYFLDVFTWNNAAIGKLLWNLCNGFSG